MRTCLMGLGFASLLCGAMVCGTAVAGGTVGSATADELVADALRAEMAGDADRRQILLDQAVAVAPQNRLARWHRGEMEADGQWQSVEDLQQAAAADPRRAEYRQLREAAGDSLSEQLALARWCRKNQLHDEAWFHWANVVARDPGNEEALRALGMRWYRNRLLTYAQIDEAKRWVREARRAAKEFAPLITKWQRAIADELPAREEALAEIRALSDHNAIPAVEEVTLGADVSTDLERVRCRQISRAFIEALSAMSAPAATESLVRHALFSPVAAVRKSAIAALRERPLHDFVPMLLDALATPIESSFRVATDSDGSVHYWHSLYREGRDARWSVEGRSSVVQMDFEGTRFGVADDQVTLLVERRASDAQVQAQKSLVAARAQNRYGAAVANTEQLVEQLNEATAASNSRFVPILSQVTGQDFGNDPKAWWDWWDGYNHFYSDGEPPLYEQRYVETDYRYYRPPEFQPYGPTARPRYSCFAPGTLVWTNTGLRKIETLDIGDVVLAQDTQTGELAYKTVMGRTVRPARPTVRLRLERETLQATLGHPIWQAGEGWQMAKKFQPGDVMHSVRGPALVESTDAGEEIEVYNLIVADYHNYFVGETGVLVHDNSPRQPTTATVPGLAAK